MLVRHFFLNDDNHTDRQTETEITKNENKRKTINDFYLFFFSFLFDRHIELEEQPTNARDLPWVAFYCVLKQDEQAFTTYCSEEFSVSAFFLFVHLFFNTILCNTNTNTHTDTRNNTYTNTGVMWKGKTWQQNTLEPRIANFFFSCAFRYCCLFVLSISWFESPTFEKCWKTLKKKVGNSIQSICYLYGHRISTQITLVGEFCIVKPLGVWILRHRKGDALSTCYALNWMWICVSIICILWFSFKYYVSVCMVYVLCTLLCYVPFECMGAHLCGQHVHFIVKINVEVSRPSAALAYTFEIDKIIFTWRCTDDSTMWNMHVSRLYIGKHLSVFCFI